MLRRQSAKVQSDLPTGLGGLVDGGRLGVDSRQMVGPFLVRRLAEDRRFPEIWRQVVVCPSQRIEGGLQEVPPGLRCTTRRGVAVAHSSKLQHLLGGWRTNNAGTTRRR